MGRKRQTFSRDFKAKVACVKNAKRLAGFMTKELSG
jgi:hypothetical protein